MSKVANKGGVTVPIIRQSKGERKVSMITAYDYPFAQLADQAGLDIILVGDSLAMVVLGHEDTLSLTMDEMIHHCKPVSRAANNALVVGDMPFLSFNKSTAQAVHNAGRMVKEGGVRAVKLEGAFHILDQIRAITDTGIPVMGHIGLTPQRINEYGGFKVQGKEDGATERLIKEAQALEHAGCFCMVLEAIPAEVAKAVTDAISIPTIGIGAGPDCNGQVLVIHDILGLYDRFVPKFVKQYAQLAQDITQALTRYKAEVEAGTFPSQDHSFHLPTS